MNILVIIKQVPDTETKILPSGDKQAVEKSSIKWVMNPYDEFAVEQALLTKTANPGTTVTALRVGEAIEPEALRTALAMGCDEAIFVTTAGVELDPFLTSKAIVGAIKKVNLNVDIIMAGKQAVDDDCAQVPLIVAEFLNVPAITNVVAFKQNGNQFEIKREIEGGSYEVYELELPFLISANKGLAVPRYPSLPGIMKAKKKIITTLTLAELGILPSDRLITFTNYELPPSKKAGKKFVIGDDVEIAGVVDTLVNHLRNDHKVI